MRSSKVILVLLFALITTGATVALERPAPPAPVPIEAVIAPPSVLVCGLDGCVELTKRDLVLLVREM